MKAARVSEAPATVKTPGRLSFISHTHTKRGRHLSTCHFDVPAEDYGPGWFTGMRAAQEFMAAVQSHGIQAEHPLHMLDIIRDAAVAIREDFYPSRHGAAAGFLRMLEHMIYFAAKNSDHHAAIQLFIDRQEEREAFMAVRARREKEAIATARKARRQLGRAAA